MDWRNVPLLKYLGENMTLSLRRIDNAGSDAAGNRYIEDTQSGLRITAKDAQGNRVLENIRQSNSAGLKRLSLSLDTNGNDIEFKLSPTSGNTIDLNRPVSFVFGSSPWQRDKNLDLSVELDFGEGKRVVQQHSQNLSSLSSATEVYDSPSAPGSSGGLSNLKRELKHIFAIHIISNTVTEVFHYRDGDFKTDASIALSGTISSSQYITLKLRTTGLVTLDGVMITNDLNASSYNDRGRQFDDLISNQKLLLETPLLQFFNQNSLVKSGVITATNFNQIDTSKLLLKDLTSASGLATLNVAGITNSDKVLKVLRAMQRILAIGKELGPNTSSPDYGNEITLRETNLIVDAGYTSSSQLAKATVVELDSLVFFEPKKEVVSSDSDEVKRAKLRHNNRAKILIASARQRAHLVSLAYMNSKNLSNPALVAAQRSEEDPAITFENIYNSGEYFDVKSDRSVFSLPAYTIALKELVDTHIDVDTAQASNAKNTLALRRPDIADIVVSSANSSQLQPKLNMINDLLRYHSNVDLTAADLANVKLTNKITDAALDTTKYPLDYPFNANYDKLDVALQNAKLQWADIGRAFNGKSFSEFSLGVGPAFVEAVAKDNAYSNNEITPAAVYSQAALLPVWGLDHLPDSAVNGKESKTQAYDKLKNVKRFVAQVGVEESKLQSLLFADLSRDEVAAGKHELLYFNRATTETGSALRSLTLSADATELSNLDDIRKDRVRRFVMLSKATAMDFVTLHHMLKSTGNRINKTMLQALAAYKSLNADYKLNIDDFISLIADIRNVGQGNGALPVATPLQTVFFRSRQAIELVNKAGVVQNVSWDPSNNSGDHALIRTQLANMLDVTEQEIKVVARMITASGTLTLNLTTLSALYRVRLLARLFKFAISDMQALFSHISNSSRLLQSNASLNHKLDALEQLVNSHKQFSQLNKQKALTLTPTELAKLTDNAARITINTAQVQSYIDKLSQAFAEAPKVTLIAVNQKLSELTVANINQAAFDSFVDNGIITTDVTPTFVASITDSSKKAKVEAYLKGLFNEQHVLFERALASLFKLTEQNARLFTSWLAAIAGNDNDKTNMPARLEGFTVGLRNKLLSESETVANKRRYFQQAKQLAKVIASFSLTTDNWRQLLLHPQWLNGLRLDSVPSFQSLLNLAEYEAATKLLDNESTPIFNLVAAQESDDDKVAMELAKWLDDSEKADLAQLLTMFSSTSPAVEAQKSLDMLARVILAHRYSKKLRLKPSTIADLLKVGTAGHKSHNELASTYKQVASALQSTEGLSKQAQAAELERTRDRLLSLALFKMKARGLPVTNEPALQRYLLTDVFTGGESKSSPVKEASLSLQDFANQVLNNEVQGHNANDIFREYWQWMYSFTTWEANRRTFFEVENFLLPELRRDKSEPFKALEKSFTAINSTPSVAAQKYKTYAKELLSLAQMESVAIGDGYPHTKDVMLIGKKQVGEQQELHCRTLTILDSGAVSASTNWQKISSTSLTSKESQSISVCYAFGQWHMFWLSYDLVKDVSTEIPAQAFAILNQISLEPTGTWSAKKVVRKAAVPIGESYVTKANFNFVRAYNPGAVEISGTKAENKAVWDRYEAIQQVLDARASSNKLAEVLHSQVAFTGQDWHSQLSRFKDHIKNVANDSSDKTYFIPAELKPNQASTLKTKETAVMSSSSYQEVDAITLVLPPVFGLYQGETINPKDVHSSGLNKLGNRLQLVNYGVDWGASSPSAQSDYSADASLSKLILPANGTVKVINANKLRAKHDTSITNQKQLHGLSFGEDYLAGSNISGLTSSGSIRRIGLVSKQQNDSEHQYLLHIGAQRFHRVRSHSATILQSYIGNYSVDDFMHPSVQTVPEGEFKDTMTPVETVHSSLPSDKLSFDDVNGSLFWELFYHTPVAIASTLKSAGQYQEAERWFHYVFNPQADENKVGIVDNKNINNITPLLKRNSFWQTLALRKASPLALEGEIYRNVTNAGDLDTFFNSPQAEPVLRFNVPKIDFNDNGSQSIGEVVKPNNIIWEKSVAADVTAVRDEDFKHCIMRIKGSQFLAAGNYVLQGIYDDGLVVKVNGNIIISNDRAGYSLVSNHPLTIEKSGIQHIEIYFFEHEVVGKLKLSIAAAVPGVTLKTNMVISGPHKSSDDDIKAALGASSHDFHVIESQPAYEQRMLTEISSIDNELALGSYIDDPYNPHAIASVNTNAYRIWTFYEYLDNIIKQGDEEFRKFTRESLPSATLIYSRAERLLGDRPIYRGMLDNLPADSKLQDIANNSLLDYDGDGDVDLDDADIQAKRLLDAGNGKLQKSLELALENRLARVSVSKTTNSVTYAEPLAEAYTGNDTSAIQLTPRYMKYQGTGVNRQLHLIEPTGRKFLPQTFLNNSYFAIPQNQRTLGLWKTVAARLFNIRNGRNINGERVVLPLTQPTLSPLALAKAAAQGGDSLSNALSGSQPAIPHYRFSYAIERAEAMTNMVISYGNKLQSLYQNKDVAQLEELRAGYEKEVVSGGKAVLQEQLKSTETAIEIVLNGYGTARYLEYKNSARKGIELSLDKAKGPHADDEAFKNKNTAEDACQTIVLSDGDDKYARIGGASRDERSNHFKDGYRDQTGDLMYENLKEKQARILIHTEYAVNAVIDAIAAGSNFSRVAPNIFGLAVGGSDWKAPIDGALGFARLANGAFGKAASELEHEASLLRRASGWEQDRQLAIQDQDELENRLIQANHDRLAVQHQIVALEQQIASNEQIFNFITVNRVTKSALFDLLIQGMESLYKQLYDIALSTAREAERAWVFEKARQQSFSVKDNWNNKRKGLLAGESLLLVLQQMRQAYQQENARRFEISKMVSLKNNQDVNVAGSSQDLVATLKAQPANARAVTFSLPSRIFDRDYPGHILRQIKSVSITIPAVVGPYENVGATLKQLNNNVLLNNDSVAAVAMAKGDISSYSGDAIRKDHRSNQAVAISTGVNDAGMFQLNFDDPRFLPFEGTGVDSTWQLQFSELMPQGIFDSINDIIMEVRYTSEPGTVKNDVVAAIKTLDAAS